MNVQALPMERFIDHHGNLVKPLPDWADVSTLTGFYRDMLLTRTYDHKAVALQRTANSVPIRPIWVQKPSVLPWGERSKWTMCLCPIIAICQPCGRAASAWKRTCNTGAAMSAAVISP